MGSPGKQLCGPFSFLAKRGGPFSAPQQDDEVNDVLSVERGTGMGAESVPVPDCWLWKWEVFQPGSWWSLNRSQALRGHSWAWKGSSCPLGSDRTRSPCAPSPALSVCLSAVCSQPPALLFSPLPVFALCPVSPLLCASVRDKAGPRRALRLRDGGTLAPSLCPPALLFLAV